MTIMITGRRGSGKTTKICELLHEAAVDHGGKSLLILEDRQATRWVDALIIENKWLINSKTRDQFMNAREWVNVAAVGTDLYRSLIADPSEAQIDIDFATFATSGPLMVQGQPIRGTFSYLRLGVHAEETMSIETAAWILNAGAGIPDGNGDGSCFVSDSGARFWWVDDRFIRKQHE